jgi:hypothetical protein
MRIHFLFLVVAGAISLDGDISSAQQITGQDVDTILARADKLLEEAKAAYEDASAKSSVQTFIDAGFKLEEARIKYLVLQEIGSADKQKIAADRLRAVNQLSKLIHDGKVSVGGTPAEPAPAKPVEHAPPAKDPAADPVAPAAKASVDVSKRAQIPDVAKQRDAEKLIRDLYKEQYAKKAQDDRKALARLLLDQASKPQDDPVFLWVLCREAQEVAVQNCDIRTLSKAIDMAARVFDVDAMVMKNVALTAAGKLAKTPEEFADLSDAFLRLLDDLIRADQYDAAEKMVTLAAQYARKATDPALASRLAVRSKEVSEAKTLFQAMKSVLEIQAKNPEDATANLEIGRFLCFVKGSWDLGLRFIVKGSDASLKTLAEKELSFPAQAADRVALADGWYDLGDKDKSPLRKSQLLAHAKGVYESALSETSGVVRAKIEKRIGELESKALSTGTSKGPIDLLGLIDIKRDTVSGEFKMSGGSLLTPNSRAVNRLQIPYYPPGEAYDIALTVQRLDGPNALFIGLVLDGQHFFVGIDNATNNEFTGIWNVEGKPGDGPNETTKKGHFLPLNKTVGIVCSVKKTGVTLTIDNKAVMTYAGSSTRLSLSGEYVGPDKNALWIGSWGSKFQVTKMILTPVAGGTGKRLYP